MKEKVAVFIIVFLLFSFPFSELNAQNRIDSLKKKNRIIWTSSALGVGYGTSTYLLNKAWYEDHPRSSFHFFNDWGEWNNVDKLGHAYVSQFQSNYAYHLYKWSGLKDKKAIIYGALTALLFQTTVEMLDGFSTDWGFSVFDFGANLLGTSLFVVQQSTWKKQNIILKVSGFPRAYDRKVQYKEGAYISLEDRADDLYGSSPASRLLKDYNAQTYWASFNVKELLNQPGWPPWLSLSLGYGSENLYGGFNNRWVSDGNEIVLKDDAFSRYHQFYLSPDLDLTKIKTNSPFIKTLLGIVNIFKFPLPTIEFTSQGDFIFHFLKF